MTTKANPGPNACYDRALPDEPLFTLLGRDPTAPFVVLFWMQLRNLMFGVSDQILEAGQCVEEMRNWAVKLGKEELLKTAHEAFKRACFEVTKAELEAAKPAEPNPGSGI